MFGRLPFATATLPLSQTRLYDCNGDQSLSSTQHDAHQLLTLPLPHVCHFNSSRYLITYHVLEQPGREKNESVIVQLHYIHIEPCNNYIVARKGLQRKGTAQKVCRLLTKKNEGSKKPFVFAKQNKLFKISRSQRGLFCS